MRIAFGIFTKKVVLDYGLKEPDFVSREEVKQYAEVEQLSPALRKLNKKLRKSSKRYSQKEWFVRGLEDSDVELLKRRGFKVTLRTKTLRDNEVILVANQYRITV
jgi:hypothetical protein